MTTLTLAIYLDRLGVLRRTLPRVRPHFDRVVLLVDSRSHTEVREFAAGCGADWSVHDWGRDYHYARAINTLIASCPPGWILNLDSDEDIDRPELLRDLVEQGESGGIDVFGLPRRHWYDLRQHESKAEWYPDHQWRLMRTEVRLRWRTHPEIVEPVRRAIATTPHIEHYNTALRTDEDWAATGQEYRSYLDLDARDGRDLSGFASAPKGVL